MTEQERKTILDVSLDFSFWANYIKVLVNRKTDEREEITIVCNNMAKEIRKLIDLVQSTNGQA